MSAPVKIANRPQQEARTRKKKVVVPTNPSASIHIVPQTNSSAAIFELINRARTGLPTSQLRAIGVRLALPVRELAPLLATTERTLARRLDQPGELNKMESERLLLLQRLTEHGVDVFEDQGKFNRWLRRPLALLGGQSPLELLDTASGFQVVDELLGRIEYGVYS